MFGIFRRGKKDAGRSAGGTDPSTVIATATPRERVEFLGNRVERFAGPAILDVGFHEETQRAIRFLALDTVSLDLEPPAIGLWGTDPYALAAAKVRVWSEEREAAGEVRLEVASTEDMAAIHDLGRMIAAAVVAPLERVGGRELTVETPTSAGSLPQPTATDLPLELVPGVACAATRQVQTLSGTAAAGLPWQLPSSPEVTEWLERPTIAERLAEYWRANPQQLPFGPHDLLVCQVKAATSAAGEQSFSVCPDVLMTAVQAVSAELEPVPAGIAVSEIIVLARD